jgi:hypothetical protein
VDFFFFPLAAFIDNVGQFQDGLDGVPIPPGLVLKSCIFRKEWFYQRSIR